MKVLVLVLILILGLNACTSKNNQTIAPKEESFVGIMNDELIYQGEITQISNTIIFKSFMQAEIKPDKLIISSQDGDISLGMELGSWVKDNNLDIEVSNICASSCANYVFPAGNKKYLRKDSVLIWHGSAWQQSWGTDDLPKDFQSSYLTPIRMKETMLLDRFGVDNLITVYGQINKNVFDHILFLFGQNKDGWDYSLKDMHRFGITNIILIDEEWSWRKYRPSQSSQVKRFTVDDDYKFKLRRFEM